VKIGAFGASDLRDGGCPSERTDLRDERAKRAGDLLPAASDGPLTTLVGAQRQGQVRVVSFGRPAPCAGGAVALRSAVITGPAAPGGAAAGRRVVASRTGGAGGAAYLASVLAFLHAQRPPYLATVITVIRIPGGQPAVRIGYPSPSPLGLLSNLTG